MGTTCEKLVNNVRTIHEHGISNNLLNANTIIITKTEHTQDALDENQFSTKRRDQSYQCLAEAWQFQKGVFEKQLMEGEHAIAAKAKMSLAILNNEIEEAEYKRQLILSIFI